MDLCFKDLDLDNITEEEESKFRDKFNYISNQLEESTEEDYVKFIRSFGESIRKYHPIRNGIGESILSSIWTQIKRSKGDKLNDSAMSEQLIYLIKCGLESGWTATNSELLIYFVRAFPESYFQNITETSLQKHLELIISSSLEYSPHDTEDNHSFIKSHMQDFVGEMTYKHFEVTFMTNHASHFMQLYESLLMRAWSKLNYETEVVHHIVYYLIGKIKTAFTSNDQIIVSIFKKLTDGLLKEEIVTEYGWKLIEDFFSKLRDCKSQVEGLDSIIRIGLDFLEQAQIQDEKKLDKIEYYFCYMINNTDKKIEKVVFEKCQDCLPNSIIFIDKLIDKYPTYSDEEEKSSRNYRDAKDEWRRKLEAFFEKMFKFIINSVEDFEAIIPSLTKLIIKNKSRSKEIFRKYFRESDKKLTNLFKTKPECAIPILDGFMTTVWKVAEVEDRTVEFPFGRKITSLNDPYSQFKDVTKSGKVFQSAAVQTCLFDHLLKIFDNLSIAGTVFISDFSEFYTFKNLTSDQSLAFFKSLKTAINSEVFKILNFNAFRIGDLVREIMETMEKNVKKHQAAYFEAFECLMILKDLELQVDYNGSDQDTTASLLILHIVLGAISKKTNDEVTKKFFPVCLEIAMATADMSGLAGNTANSVAIAPNFMATPSVLSDSIGQIFKFIEQLKEADNFNLITQYMNAVNMIVGKDADLIVEHMETVEKLFLDLYEEDQLIYFFLDIFDKIFKKYAKRCHEGMLKILFDLLDRRGHMCTMITNIFMTVSNDNGAAFVPYLDQMMSCMGDLKISVAYGLMEVYMEINKVDLKAGETLFHHIVDLVKNDIENTMFVNMLLNHLRVYALYNHPLLVGIKEDVEKWQSSNPGLHDACQHLLDVIADRSLAGLEADLGVQKEKVVKVEEKVDEQQVKVEKIENDVAEHEQKIEIVNERVDQTNERVDKIEEDVEQLDEQVQEIDLKTVSNAPKWAREVSVLLNVESDTDWRLLAQRLGYSNEEIRDWSTHADPCMSLLSDWFAVRRNIEATRAVLEQLIEMDRMDAAQIVEKALTAAEAVISDEEPAEYLEPPSVFLSYQWGSQEEVKVLRYHLEKAGYRCWMDIGQMGGGDKLFEAIDRGIRGAKVFVPCVTPKYAESANCKRELNLSINLHKPVIPLQMERMDWPPAGTMGPLLTEYIFIRMFAKPGVKVVEGTFWPDDRFRELLMQIRYSVAPQYDIVDQMYDKWWEPPQEIIQYKARQKEVEKVEQKAQSEESKSPLVFLSYQWGKQEQVKSLYNLLTREHGVTCWMDIYEMGGGDSLYDKIDRGVRGCNVVVCCVTGKYAESLNCRKEVSLADGIKKPIIPIKLEHIDWPPSGPMSMALATLVPVDLVDEQAEWNGPQTQEFLGRISQYLPGQLKINVEKSSSKLDSKQNVNDVKEEKEEKRASLNDLKRDSIHKSTKLEPINNGTDEMTHAIHVNSTTSAPTNFKSDPEIAKSKSCHIL